MTVKLIVGYRTRAIDEAVLKTLMPTFTAPSNWKDPDKIAQYQADAQTQFITEAKDSPYTATFDEVFIADPAHEKPKFWTYKDREPGGKKPPICLAIRNWLLTTFPTAWSWEIMDGRKQPEVIFIGFNMRRFLKILGIECSLPQHAQPLPPKLWYSNSDHRDIEEAVCPSDFKRLTLSVALQCRRPIDPEGSARWDENLEGWTAPGEHPQKDIILATELAAQLGFLQEGNKPADPPLKKAKKT